VKTRKTRIPKCIWRKINGQHVLDEREMPTKYLPIIRVVGNQWIVEGKPIVSGIVRNAKDAVRMYNYNASMEVELNALAPRAPFVGDGRADQGPRGPVAEREPVNYGLPLQRGGTTRRPGRSPTSRRRSARSRRCRRRRSSRRSSRGGRHQEDDRAVRPEPRQQPAVEVRHCAAARAGEVRRRHLPLRRQPRQGARYAGTIIVDMIPRVYTGKRIARILGEDGEPDHVVLDPPSIRRGAGRVRRGDTGEAEVHRQGLQPRRRQVRRRGDTGPSFTTKRQEASEFLTNAIQSAKDPEMAQVLTYLALKSNDWAGAEEATEMVKKLLPKGSCRRKARRRAADPARGAAGDVSSEAGGRAARTASSRPRSRRSPSATPR
jgi:hypothetical protein